MELTLLYTNQKLMSAEYVSLKTVHENYKAQERNCIESVSLIFSN